MDDSCAVCAESLEWVAYGACGHKDVCSTCVARLRFICDDRCCCICKTETDVVFVTKALGDYTKTISDFSLLPSERKEGRVGQYWYHEDTQALFDDFDHYKMIKAMCRLSCSVCDKMEDQAEDGSRRRSNFRNIDQLKGHLSYKHKLSMCSLCLEGRKVFICEQNLYTRSQLAQHKETGDAEVDGGGFSGHPLCQFCRSRFYGDNELHTHMSTEHYTCHICRRQHPDHFEYFNNYDDLEDHFRRDHVLCEDDSCLAKKFIVFPSEAELKRHNALEHGGRMSRSQCSVALQSVGAKGAARGGKRPRSSGRASSSPDHGQQVGLTAPSADNCPPTASPPRKLMKPAGVIDITGGESSQAGPPNQLDDLPFSEGVRRVVRWLEQAAVRNEDEKDRYSEQLIAARARLGKAKDEVKTIKAELAAQLAKTYDAEVEAKKARDKAETLEDELKTASDGQGEVLRAYTKRLLLSDHFSGLANDLAELINGNAAMDALEEAAKDFPDLDVSKYGYERLEGAALFSRYAEVIRGHLGRIPILNELASSPELLTAEQVTACPIDREPDLDAAFDALPDEIEEDDEEEEEQEAGGDPILSKGAEGPKAAEAEDFAEGPSAGQQLTQEKEVGDP